MLLNFLQCARCLRTELFSLKHHAAVDKPCSNTWAFSVSASQGSGLSSSKYFPGNQPLSWLVHLWLLNVHVQPRPLPKLETTMHGSSGVRAYTNLNLPSSHSYPLKARNLAIPNSSSLFLSPPFFKCSQSLLQLSVSHGYSPAFSSPLALIFV